MSPFTVVLRVAADHPALPGHFADRPIVPAATILSLLDGAVAQQLRTSRVASVSYARFRRPLSPGVDVRVAFFEAGPGSLRFTIDGAEGRIADGELTLGEAQR